MAKTKNNATKPTQFVDADSCFIVHHIAAHYTEIQDERDEYAVPNMALTMARSAPSTYVNSYVVNLITELLSCPEFYKMMDEIKSGDLDLRDFAAFCYTAEKISVSFPS